MKILAITLAALTVLLVGSTLLCGLWLRAKGATPEGTAFHVKLAVPTAVVTLVTVAILLFQ
jgi:hypothetical protein